MPLPLVRRLLVEGAEDLRVIPQLIEQAAGLRWGERGQPKLVDIVVAGSESTSPSDRGGGVERLLERGYIATEYKTARLQALGVMMDADDDPVARWRQLCGCDLPFAAELPAAPPADGLVLQPASDGPRFGVWMMPDNSTRGMLETFLLALRPDDPDQALWQWADEVVAQALQKGAPFRSAHHDKARVHTFLAWQDPPGRQLHEALQQRLLNPKAALAQRFVNWFRRLYQV